MTRGNFWVWGISKLTVGGSCRFVFWSCECDHVTGRVYNISDRLHVSHRSASHSKPGQFFETADSQIIIHVVSSILRIIITL